MKTLVKNVLIDSQTFRAMRVLAERLKVSLDSVLVAAHCKVLSIFTSEMEVEMGVPREGTMSVDHEPDSTESSSIGSLYLSLGRHCSWARLILDADAALARLATRNGRSPQRIQLSTDTYDTNLDLRRQDVSACLENTETDRPNVVLFIVGRDTNDLSFSVGYSVAISHDAASTLAGYYARILRAIATDSASSHAERCLLPEDERETLLRSWNDTSRDFPPKANLVQLFEEQARRTPFAIASISTDGRLTYGELDRRSNQLARYLKSLGVGPEILVGICMERTNLMLIGLLGIMKAGGGYVPLDPRYPEARLHFMLSDVGVKLVVTQKSLVGCLPRGLYSLLLLDVEDRCIAQRDATVLDCEALPGNVAYLVYTSGSTGQPKAAAIEHKSVIDLLYWARDEFGCDLLQGVLASSSICFDMSIFELYAPLIWGGTVILVDSIMELRDLKAASEITLISTVPSALCTLAELDWVPETVHAALLAGEPLSREVAVRIFNASKLSTLWNAYGLSEDTTYTTTSRLERGFEGPVTIGRAIANRQLYVLDEHQMPVPIGVVGELYVSGKGLARGYVNRPALTAECFLRNPFVDKPNTLMYRSGDLVRYINDGTLEYLGRKDHQTKIRGHRIELGEIEARLAEHSGVSRCAVVCRDDGADGKRLVAYVEERDGESVSADLLAKHLREKLPKWMIPAVIVRLERIPTTVHGKLDRCALPAPETCLPI